MAQEPPHLVQTGATSQPARCGEVLERMRVKAPVMGQAGLGAQPVENLDEVSVLERPARAVAEQDCPGRRRRVTVPATS